MRQGDAHRFLFYLHDLAVDSTSPELAGDEHHHIRSVLRMRSGDGVFVTNGRGLIVRCAIEGVERRKTVLRVEESVVNRDELPELALALGCLRKDAFEQAVKQCTEIGVTRFLPFASDRAHLRDYSPPYLERLRRIAMSAMKQSFRSWLPAIEPAVELDGLVAAIAGFERTIVADIDGGPVKVGAGDVPLLLVVGPEAGLTSDERDRLAGAGCDFARVTPHRLRSETAAAALAALVVTGRGRDGDL